MVHALLHKHVNAIPGMNGTKRAINVNQSVRPDVRMPSASNQTLANALKDTKRMKTLSKWIILVTLTYIFTLTP